MDLHEITRLSKEAVIVYLENYVNNGSPSGFSNQKTVLGEFSAGRTTPIELILIKTNLSIMEYFSQSKLVQPNMLPGVLAIHPLVVNELKSNESINDYDIYGKVDAYVTASGRTVLAEFGSDTSFIKLHFPDVLGRVNRHLPLRKAIAGVEISDMVVGLISSGAIKEMGILPEIKCCGIVRNGLDDSIACIERATKVVKYGGIDTSSYLFPGFSLFSRDSKNPEDRTLIQQICEKFSITKPEDFYEKIIHPILEGYLKLTFSFGLMPEINAQNILFAIDFTECTIYPVLRDMGRVEKLLYINPELETLVSCPYKTISEDQKKYALKRHSFSFDFKLTNYVLEPLIDSYSRMVSSSNKNIKCDIYQYASETLDGFSNVRNFLPKYRKTVAHPNILLTKERPYIEIGDPLIQ